MNEYTIYLIFSILLLCLAGSCLIGFLNFKSLPFSFKALTFYTLFAFILELTGVVLAKLCINNLFGMHLFTLVEFIFFALFFRPLFKVPVFFVKYYDWIAGFVVIIIIGYSLFVQPISLMNVYSETLENIVLIFFSILYFCNLYLNDVDEEEDQYRNPIVWVNSGLILYLSGSLFIFMFSEYILVHSTSSQWIIWVINVTLNLIFKILVLLAFLRVARIIKKKPIDLVDSSKV